jgi:Mrp family chromosome partitioning ATPase
MVGGSVGVLWDAFKGTIFSATDLKELGVISRFVKVSVLRPLNATLFKALFAKNAQKQIDQIDVISSSSSLQESLQNLQNNLESIRPNAHDPLMTFVSSAKPLKELPLLAYAFAQQSSLRGGKTLLIEGDLKATPLTSLLQSLQVLSDKKKAKDDFSIISVTPTLDVLLGLPKAVPATHLRSEAMKQVIEEAKKTYGHIVFSAPALLPDQSALSVLPYTNASLLVTKSAVSTTSSTIQAFNMLAEHGVQAFEAVVYQPSVGLRLPTWLVNPLSLLKK